MVGGDTEDYVNSEIVCTLAALGYLEDGIYFKGDDCLECLKDLIRFLRVDDASCEIRRQLGRSQAVEKDLIPLLKSCTQKEHDIFDVCIRLLVNLTQPTMICFGRQEPKNLKEKDEAHWFIEVTSHLQSYKEAFTDREVMSVIGGELGRLLQLEWDKRQEEDMLLIERILLLLRNILHVPADPKAEKRTDEDATIHDQVLWNLHACCIDDFIIYVASSPDESRWCMHALEIISHMMREQKADVVAKTAAQKTQKEIDDDMRELEILYEREKAAQTRVFRKSSRHSNFGGTFHVENIKALNDENNLLYHKPLQQAKNLSFDFGKTAPRKRKAEMRAREQDIGRKSTLSVRLFLKEFCVQFLENAYNPLMHTIKDNLKQSRTQENDESYYLWAMRFFMEFNRHVQFNVAYISETLNVPTFQDIVVMITRFFDNLTTIKNEKLEWGRRLHLGVRAYQELIQHIALLQASKDNVLRDSAKIIKENIFYVPEYKDVFIVLLKKFDSRSQTKSFLRDLIEAFHVFLKLLEGHCKNKGHVIVQKKNKVKKRKKKGVPKQQPVVALTADQKEERWQELSGEFSEFLQNQEGGLPSIVHPFDPVSDEPEEDQKTRCLSIIQQRIREKLFGESLAFLRAAREIWTNDLFGKNEMEPEEEFMCFYDIFRLDLPVINNRVEEMPETAEQEDELTDPEAEELQAVQVKEIEFQLADFLKQLASPLVIKPYCWLLACYEENSYQMNHYIVKMLHRVAVDLKLHAMLFQLSLFMTFKKVFNDPASSKYKELVKFSKYILTKFFELLPNNPTLCAELLFWKSSLECYGITEGFDNLQLRALKRSSHSWTFEEEEELKQLYNEFKDSEDLVEKILQSINNEFRSRRQVVGKLITLGLVENREILKKKPGNKNSWSDDEQNELRHLFEEFKDTEDVVNGILMALSNKRRTRRQVVNQLVKLEIVQDRSILQKKKSKKWRKQTNAEYPEENGNSGKIDEDEDDESEDIATSDESSHDGEDKSDLESDDETTGSDFISLLADVKNSEHSEQLEWIKNKLNGVADDRFEDDDWQPLPLVTITEESELALRNKSFQKLLKEIGLVPPADEQEKYWRIPSNLSPGHLRKAATELDMDLPELPNFANFETQKTKPHPKRQKLAALAASITSSSKREKRAMKRREKVTDEINAVSVESVDVQRDEESTEDKSEFDVIENAIEKAVRLKKIPKRKRIRVEDSDESDDDALRIHGEKNHNHNEDDNIEDDTILTLRRAEDEDDVMNVGIKRNRSLDHDENDDETSDEDELEMPLVRVKRARKVVFDDGDDDDDD
ncbi:protein timeless homolog [Xenia sp. Carnegie-2017]|uniref:protein timeless homolog n=1 Tax=Xenia sp. Carnegie-2017 TaxID=2897299 RepID=UPI001F045A78|nr:protein timeless homolog [Xenia sp. Carnegie-2017]